MTNAHEVTIEAVREAKPGERFRRLFHERWPAYQRWMSRAEPMRIETCIAQLREHMPELMPTFDTLLNVIEGGDEAARFLSLYAPPRLVRACSQVMLDTPDGPVLLRTYDYAPHLFDGVVLASHWNSVETLVVADCVWGALDGVNSSGLAVALAFGGMTTHAPGFAASLVVRYLLETCTTSGEAKHALARLPVAMPYTFAVLDRNGTPLTAFLAPGERAHFTDARASTNHRDPENWPAYERFSGSIERLACLNHLLERDAGLEAHLEAMLRPPIWRTRYALGAGTLYAVAYRPAEASMTLHWPDRVEHFAPGHFVERSFAVTLPEAECSSRA